MKLLDRIALNRLLTVISHLILSIVKILAHHDDEVKPPSPPHKKPSILNRIKKKLTGK
jgi:hypothetical protein